MIEKYINKSYINNYSDINSFKKDNEFIKLISKLKKDKYIKVTSKLIHKSNEIDQIEQFIFNLDNYITYIKQLVHINPLELRYILNLTLYNKYNKLLYSDLYYYENTELYINTFKKIFMYNYKENIKKITNNFKIQERTFEELIKIINKHKKRTYCYFEKINISNMNFYISMIEQLENFN